MAKINITLPDNSVQAFSSGSTPADIALSISERLAQDAIAAVVNHKTVDLITPITSDASVQIISKRDEAGQEVLLHSTAHLMAQAIKRLFPEAKIAIGPSIEERFYYDIDLDRPVSAEMLGEIEAEMKRIIKEDIVVERRELSHDEALKLFAGIGEDYKVEIIEGIDKGEMLSAYSQGEFIDLCRGPHVPSTGKLKYFKLLSTSGAYWRGDEKNKMLQRIYGTSWGDKKSLKEYLHRQEEAKRRDHRKLGKELDLFSFHPLATASPFFHPRGAVIYLALQEFMRELYRKYDYDEVITPQLFGTDLWKQSGHWDHYRDDLFLVTEGDEEERWKGLKPMNCPGHALIYATQMRSYRDLPIRYADFGRLHRNEKAGVVSGLTRVRSFAQDDAHLFVTPEQIEGEMESLFAMVQEVYDTFGFEDIEVKLSTRPDKYIGDPELWDKAEKILADTLTAAGTKFEVDPGEGAFYGPKIDYFFRDSLRRKWQLTTIQLDFSLPKRFGLKYIDRNSEEQQPVMIHRAILGSLERFMGVYLEHTGGDLPLWLAPAQVTILPISEKFIDYAEGVFKRLKSAGLRVQLDDRDEKVGAKIRHAELMKTPVMLIVGEREQKANTVSLRRRHAGDIGSFSVDEIITTLTSESKKRMRYTYKQG